MACVASNHLLWLVACVASHRSKPRFVAAARSVTARHSYNGNAWNEPSFRYIHRFTSASLDLRIIVPRIFNISPYRYRGLSIGPSMGS
ncbi:hypothetical protein FPQ18DRAFT_335119 [Pyronema domesticum]|nr:hypothetical protein FPQ18DRAFT_335119 [Pyronema domesticum]